MLFFSSNSLIQILDPFRELRYVAPSVRARSMGGCNSRNNSDDQLSLATSKCTVVFISTRALSRCFWFINQTSNNFLFSSDELLPRCCQCLFFVVVDWTRIRHCPASSRVWEAPHPPPAHRPGRPPPPPHPGPLCTATRQQEALSLPSAAARAHVTPKILLILDLVKFFFSKRDSIKASSILIACNTVMHLLSLK
jgi:hypothetical protein